MSNHDSEFTPLPDGPGLPEDDEYREFREKLFEGLSVPREYYTRGPHPGVTWLEMEWQDQQSVVNGLLRDLSRNMGWAALYRKTDLSLFIIYDHPKDYPDSFVVRRWVTKDGQVIPGEARVAATLGEVHGLLPPGLFCLGREEGDDPVIVETWV